MSDKYNLKVEHSNNFYKTHNIKEGPKNKPLVAESAGYFRYFTKMSFRESENPKLVGRVAEMNFSEDDTATQLIVLQNINQLLTFQVTHGKKDRATLEKKRDEIARLIEAKVTGALDEITLPIGCTSEADVKDLAEALKALTPQIKVLESVFRLVPREHPPAVVDEILTLLRSIGETPQAIPRDSIDRLQTALKAFAKGSLGFSDRLTKVVEQLQTGLSQAQEAKQVIDLLNELAKKTVSSGLKKLEASTTGWELGDYADVATVEKKLKTVLTDLTLVSWHPDDLVALYSAVNQIERFRVHHTNIARKFTEKKRGPFLHQLDEALREGIKSHKRVQPLLNKAIDLLNLVAASPKANREALAKETASLARLVAKQLSPTIDKITLPKVVASPEDVAQFSKALKALAPRIKGIDALRKTLLEHTSIANADALLKSSTALLETLSKTPESVSRATVQSLQTALTEFAKSTPGKEIIDRIAAALPKLAAANKSKELIDQLATAGKNEMHGLQNKLDGLFVKESISRWHPDDLFSLYQQVDKHLETKALRDTLQFRRTLADHFIENGGKSRLEKLNRELHASIKAEQEVEPLLKHGMELLAFLQLAPGEKRELVASETKKLHSIIFQETEKSLATIKLPHACTSAKEASLFAESLDTLTPQMDFLATSPKEKTLLKSVHSLVVALAKTPDVLPRTSIDALRTALSAFSKKVSAKELKSDVQKLNAKLDKVKEAKHVIELMAKATKKDIPTIESKLDAIATSGTLSNWHPEDFLALYTGVGGLLDSGLAGKNSQLSFEGARTSMEKRFLRTDQKPFLSSVNAALTQAIKSKMEVDSLIRKAADLLNLTSRAPKALKGAVKHEIETLADTIATQLQKMNKVQVPEACTSKKQAQQFAAALQALGPQLQNLAAIHDATPNHAIALKGMELLEASALLLDKLVQAPEAVPRSAIDILRPALASLAKGSSEFSKTLCNKALVLDGKFAKVKEAKLVIDLLAKATKNDIASLEKKLEGVITRGIGGPIARWHPDDLVALDTGIAKLLDDGELLGKVQIPNFEGFRNSLARRFLKTDQKPYFKSVAAALTQAVNSTKGIEQAVEKTVNLLDLVNPESHVREEAKSLAISVAASIMEGPLANLNLPKSCTSKQGAEQLAKALKTLTPLLKALDVVERFLPGSSAAMTGRRQLTAVAGLLNEVSKSPEALTRSVIKTLLTSLSSLGKQRTPDWLAHSLATLHTGLSKAQTDKEVINLVAKATAQDVLQLEKKLDETIRSPLTRDWPLDEVVALASGVERLVTTKLVPSGKRKKFAGFLDSLAVLFAKHHAKPFLENIDQQLKKVDLEKTPAAVKEKIDALGLLKLDTKSLPSLITHLEQAAGKDPWAVKSLLTSNQFAFHDVDRLTKPLSKLPKTLLAKLQAAPNSTTSKSLEFSASQLEATWQRVTTLVAALSSSARAVKGYQAFPAEVSIEGRKLSLRNATEATILSQALEQTAAKLNGAAIILALRTVEQLNLLGKLVPKTKESVHKRRDRLVNSLAEGTRKTLKTVKLSDPQKAIDEINKTVIPQLVLLKGLLTHIPDDAKVMKEMEIVFKKAEQLISQLMQPAKSLELHRDVLVDLGNSLISLYKKLPESAARLRNELQKSINHLTSLSRKKRAFFNGMQPPTPEYPPTLDRDTIASTVEKNEERMKKHAGQGAEQITKLVADELTLQWGTTELIELYTAIKTFAQVHGTRLNAIQNTTLSESLQKLDSEITAQGRALPQLKSLVDDISALAESAYYSRKSFLEVRAKIKKDLPKLEGKETSVDYVNKLVSWINKSSSQVIGLLDERRHGDNKFVAYLRLTSALSILSTIENADSISTQLSEPKSTLRQRFGVGGPALPLVSKAIETLRRLRMDVRRAGKEQALIAEEITGLASRIREFDEGKKGMDIAVPFTKSGVLHIKDKKEADEILKLLKNASDQGRVICERTNGQIFRAIKFLKQHQRTLNGS